MGSGSSYSDSSAKSSGYSSWTSEDTSRRSEVLREHRAVLSNARMKIERGEVARPPPVQRDVSQVLDRGLAKNPITHPSSSAKRAVVVLVDNSGSNRAIAEHLRNSSGYFTAFLKVVDPDAEVAFIYFSDHCDGSRMMQYSDFISPTELGDKILYSSLANVSTANGGDTPEAIECALYEAANIDFAHVAQKDRTIILVTDSIPHGMKDYDGGDEGCPEQRDWRTSMRDVRSTYGRFVLIGSGADTRMGAFQRRLFETSVGVSDEVDVSQNFIDLSTIYSSQHRNGIVGNAVLFVLARNGGKQAVPVFLARLFSKWMESPVFGMDTERLAKERISGFANLYLAEIMSKEEISKMLSEIFAD